MLRVVFMGTPDFGCPALEALHNAGHNIVAAVCQPDQPAGRGRRLTAPAVKNVATELGVPVLQPTRVSRPQAVEQLRALAPDVIVTAAFGQLLSAQVLQVPRLGAVNVHASLLPRWRGAAPIHRAVMAGDAETGITIMWMDEGLDTGDILMAAAVPVAADDTAGTLHDRLAALGAALTVQALALVAAGTAPRVPQDHSQATYAAKITNADEEIDWSRDSSLIRNQIRGLNPWPGARTHWNGNPLKVWTAQVDGTPGLGVEAAPGTVVGITAKGPAVATGDGSLVLTEVQPAGKRRMGGCAFLAGYQVGPGTRFGP